MISATSRRVYKRDARDRAAASTGLRRHEHFARHLQVLREQAKMLRTKFVCVPFRVLEGISNFLMLSLLWAAWNCALHFLPLTRLCIVAFVFEVARNPR